MKKPLGKLFRHLALAGVIGGLTASAALAGGFQLFEMSAAGLGNFYAGSEAEAADASTGYYNPAGLTLLHHTQVMVSGIGVFTHGTFKGSTTWSNPAIASGVFVTENGSDNGGASGFVPSINISVPVNKRITVGFGIYVPFGLLTQFPEDGFTRYAATKSSIQDIDISPSVGIALTHKISVGVGLDVEHLTAELDTVVGVPIGANPTAFDSTSENDVNDWGTGWHAGILFQPTPTTRFGFTYHSKVRFVLRGTSTLTGPAAGGFQDQTGIASTEARAAVTLPDTYAFGAYHELDPKWAVLGSIDYTDWKTLSKVTLQNVATTQNGAPALGTISIPLEWQGTWRVATGLNYSYNSKVTIRTGVAFDETPTVNLTRNLRLPGGDRVALAIGGHYQATKDLGLDVGYAHLFFLGDARVFSNTVSSTQNDFVDGSVKNRADLIGAQLTYTFM